MDTVVNEKDVIDPKDDETKKSLHHNQPEKIGVIEKLAYGCGDLASNLVLVLTGTYITFFYTDALGLNISIIGTIVLVSRIFDGITDILMGFIMDKTKSKYGKARPWMLWMSIPFGLSTILMMLVPMNWGDVGKYIFVFITYNLATTILYTAINIPYGALNSLMTRDQHERENINIWRMTMAQLGSLAINAFTLPLINTIGNSSSQKSWIIVSIIYGVSASLLFLFCFFMTKERVHISSEQKEKISFGKTFKLLMKNKYWLLICLIWIVMAVGMGIGMGVGTYYCKYILKNENLYGYLSVVSTICLLICMPFLGKPIKKYGKRNVAFFGSILYAISMALRMIAPHSVVWLMICSGLSGIASSTLTATIFAMVADTIEYGQWKTGTRVEGMLYSATTFGAKVGAGLGLAVGSVVLGIAGYDGTLAVQNAATESAIYWMYIIVPVFFLIGIPIILHFYNLDKEYPNIMKDLARRESENKIQVEENK